MSNKKLTQTKADQEPTYTEMVFEAIDNLELATLENIDLFLFCAIYYRIKCKDFWMQQYLLLSYHKNNLDEIY